jgi:hypothetical protein
MKNKMLETKKKMKELRIDEMIRIRGGKETPKSPDEAIILV